MRTQAGKFTLSGDGLCVGYDSGDAVSQEYKTPGTFRGGKIEFAGVTVDKAQYFDLEQEARRVMMAQSSSSRREDRGLVTTYDRHEARVGPLEAVDSRDASVLEGALDDVPLHTTAPRRSPSFMLRQCRAPHLPTPVPRGPS